MKLSLKEWKQVEGIFRDLRKAVEHADVALFKLANEKGLSTPEGELLMKLWMEIHDIRQEMRTTAELHPQSEWTGGVSDDPRNHKLREPNICPLPRRYFTPEELKEAGAVCHGPVQWRFNDAPQATQSNPS